MGLIAVLLIGLLPFAPFIFLANGMIEAFDVISQELESAMTWLLSL